MQLPTFETERYYAQYEFTCPHLLSVSDCESMSIGGLLELAEVSQDALLDQQLGYTESAGRASLRSAIANRYDTVKAEHVLLLNSPIEGLYLLSQLFTGPTIVLLPAYDALKNLPKNLLGWKLKPTETGWELDWESLDRLGKRNVELLVVNFPHNPTGFQPTPQDWTRLLSWAKDRGVWLFCDEMYRGLGPRLPSAVDLYEKSVILNGLSKPQGLPGLRAGWLVSRNPELLDKLLGLRLYTSICTAAPVEFLAEVALKVEPEILKRNTDIVAKNVQLASQFFAFHSAFHWRPPVAGSVALVELPKGYEAEEYCHTLAEIYGVVLLPSSFLGVEDRYVRFGFGRRGFSGALQAYDRVLNSQLDVSVAD